MADPNPDLRVEAHRKGAAITNSGKSPIASLPDDKRQALLSLVIQRSLEDRRLKDVAQELGVHRSALNQALLKYCEDDWKEAQTARYLVMVEDCEEELEKAADMTAVSRARERLRSAQWQLERTCRRIYGQDAQTVLGSGQVNIQINFNQDKTGG